MLRSGDLVHRVSIKGPGAPTRTAGGGTVPGAPVTVAANVPARVRDLSGLERQTAMQTQTRATKEVALRFREDLTSAMWFEWALGDVTHTLQMAEPPRDPKGDRRDMYVNCRVG